MSDPFNMQEAIFMQIKNKLPANLSMVHEISELLGLSYDSAYRRIRGEKVISLEELYKLCTHFELSVDSLFEIKRGRIVFNSLAIDPEKTTVKDWMNNLLGNLQALSNASHKKIIYAAKDAPFFHYFHIPELAIFKLFFWQKTLFQFPEYRDRKFSFHELDPELQQLGQRILLHYMKIPVIEIWNEDTFYMMLRQMDYYWVSGMFEHKNDLLSLIDHLENWIQHLRKQAEYGFQFFYGQKPNGLEGTFCLYENEVVLSDNTVLAELEQTRITFLSYNVVNLLTTSDPAFCGKIEQFLKGLIKNSMQISTNAAKERNRFFHKLEKSISEFRQRIQSQ